MLMKSITCGEQEILFFDLEYLYAIYFAVI